MIITRETLSRTPTELITRIGNIAIYSDEFGGYFEVYKVSNDGFLVTGGW